MAKTFGQLLGEIILQKRKTLGLTQIQLSEDAYESVAKVRRISELENGKTSNPHPKTIDPLIVTLGISEQEIEECARLAIRPPDPDLTVAFTDAENLLRRVANSFELINPEVSLDELNEFLVAKAKEYIALKEKIKELSAEVPLNEHFWSDVSEKLNSGDFDMVDDLLGQAEELLQNTQTLESIRKQAEIRIARGDSKFLQGKLEECYTLYNDASFFFKPFDQHAMADMFSELARRIYEGGRRSIAPSFWIAQKLLITALTEVDKNSENELIHADLNYCLSLVLRNQAAGLKTSEATDLLRSSVSHAREAVRIFANIKGEKKLQGAQVSLGTNLLSLAKHTGKIEDFDAAIEVLETANQALSSQHGMSVIRGHAANNLGAAILGRDKYTAEIMADESLEQARSAFMSAINASEISLDREVWSGANANLGKILFDQSRNLDPKSDSAQFLRTVAMSRFLASIEFFPSTRFPVQFAESHFMLAEVLYEHGLYSEDDLFEMYFARAIQSFEQVLEIISREVDPGRWAYIQCRLGGVFGNHAMYGDVDSKKFDLTTAISYFEAGQSVFFEIDDSERVASCEENLERLHEELSSLAT